MTKEKRTGIIWQIVAYSFAIYLAIETYEHFDFSEIGRILIASIVATSVIFFFSYAFKNASFYVPYWSLQPILISAFLISQEQANVNTTRQLIVFLIILVWGIRIIVSFFSRWSNLEHEESLYIRFREQNPQWFPFVSYFGIMLLPTILVYAGCIPLFDILKYNNLPFGVWDIIATVIAIIGITFQWISDIQLFKFLKNRTEHSNIMNTGLWKYSRHPNYFGEICIWTALAIFSIGAVGDLEWYNALGTIGIIIFFNLILIPIQEKQLIIRKPHYANEQAIRSTILPWKPKG